MIRRRSHGQFVLVTQPDHARLAERLAEHFGNGQFAPALPHEPTISGIAMHDCGWREHDEVEPVLVGEHLPPHVFQMPLPIALKAWQLSADEAQAHGDYCGLLVSIHVLGLSAIPASREHPPRERFELNRFQQHEIERQEGLRRRLGMRTDRPLCYGVAAPGTGAGTGGADEEQLTFNVRLLQTMDRVSLALLCADDGLAPASLFERIDDVLPRPGKEAVSLKLRRAGDALVINPWPFDVATLAFDVPCRCVSEKSYATTAEFRQVYAASPRERLTVTVRKC